jgi:hypothetical protein
MLTVAIACDLGANDFGELGPLRDQVAAGMIALAFVRADASARAARWAERG